MRKEKQDTGDQGHKHKGWCGTKQLETARRQKGGQDDRGGGVRSFPTNLYSLTVSILQRKTNCRCWETNNKNGSLRATGKA